MLARYMLWPCLSVRLTFKGHYCTRMAKHRITVLVSTFSHQQCLVVKYYAVKYGEPRAKYIYPISILLCPKYCFLCVYLCVC